MVGKSHRQRLCVEVDQRVGVYNKKIKIYQTIKGPDHSIYQAPVLYQVQLGLQTILYPTSTSVLITLSLALSPIYLYYLQYAS